MRPQVCTTEEMLDQVDVHFKQILKMLVFCETCLFAFLTRE